MRVGRICPASRLIKAQTLGATTWQIVLRVVLPQVLPRLIDRGAPVARAGLAVPDRRRGDRRHRRASATASSWCGAISPWTSSCPTSPWITLLAFAFDWLLRLFVAPRLLLGQERGAS